jgi:Spy/CpxP family protein refolding chaperone
MRRMALVCTLALVLLAAVSLEAAAAMPGGRWWNDTSIQQNLGLSPEQAGQIKAVYGNHRNQMVDLKGELRKRQMEFEDLLAANPVDKAALAKKIDEVTAARTSLDRERLGTLVEVRSVLSAEQYGKLRTVQRQKMKGAGRRGRTGGGPPVNGDEL